MYFNVCIFVKRFETLLSGKRIINVSLLLLSLLLRNYRSRGNGGDKIDYAQTSKILLGIFQ